MAEDQRTNALFALWHGVGEQTWNEAPVVPTESGAWVQARNTLWLNEEPPSEKEPSGKAIANALAEFLPGDGERVPLGVRLVVNRTDNEGTRWLKRQHQEVKLASLVRQACEGAEENNDLLLVELLEWALSRGDRRQDLVPLVRTENGALKPPDALLADPLVEGGKSRRELFFGKPALVEDYAIINDQHAVVLFLERLGVPGGGSLITRSIKVERWGSQRVAEMIGVDKQDVQPSNNAGYSVYDCDLPFETEKVPPEALQDWLSREHTAFRGKNSWHATSFYNYHRSTPGSKPATWVSKLQDQPWLLCIDGQRRKPGEVILESDPDFQDAPIAEIDPSLASRLNTEGIKFGYEVPKSPVLRRSALRGATDMPDSELAALLREAKEHVEAGEATLEELDQTLVEVRLRGVPLSRVVRRSGAGSGMRGDLGGWVIGLSNANPVLAEAVLEIRASIPETTTGTACPRILARSLGTKTSTC